MNLDSNDKTKLAVGAGGGVAILTIARALAQTNGVPITPLPGDGGPNILSAEYHQVLNNPASLMVIGFLMVLAWLMDDTPIINSRYVAHITVCIGAGTYWMFAGPSSVPTSFPYPFVVLVANGTLCGFIAFLFHRQAVARLICFFRSRTGNTQFISNPNPPNKTNPPT